MKNTRIPAIFVLMAFIFSLIACAGAPIQSKQDGKSMPAKSAKQMKFEQEEESRSLFIKGIGAFSGLVIGGLVGVFTSQRQNVVTSAIGGCVAGGGIGFLLGMVVFDNTKPGPKPVDEKKIQESFQEYRNIQLKE